MPERPEPPELAIEGEVSPVRCPGRPGRPGGRDPGGRRLDPGRVAVAILAVVLLGVVGMLSPRACDGLYRQKVYLVAPTDIRLQPDPPPYVRSGRVGLLERVIAGAKWPEALAAPAFDRDELAGAFAKYSPWVQSVEGIQWSYPNRLTVRLTYRRPVALVKPVQGGPILVDSQGVVLDRADYRPVGRVALPWITSVPLGAIEEVPGKLLGSLDEDGMRKLLAAAELATFVLDKNGPLSAGEVGLPIGGIDVRYAPEDLFVWATGGFWVEWGPPPGREAPGQPTADQKWARFRTWVEAHPEPQTRTERDHPPPCLVLTEGEPRLKETSRDQ